MIKALRSFFRKPTVSIIIMPLVCVPVSSTLTGVSSHDVERSEFTGQRWIQPHSQSQTVQSRGVGVRSVAQPVLSVEVCGTQAVPQDRLRCSFKHWNLSHDKKNPQ
ncbi:hypothetical protein F7725_002270 [Dissostichus mawsoni]|uniref:Uncharacterized protein n=1 Tax=Dissostichus mawsoni TaxID=36200 RepID=A0A7J5Y331_DISMA|nr:hypothetical protein F7725_002270 [Dissostichus mawsoni]